MKRKVGGVLKKRFVVAMCAGAALVAGAAACVVGRKHVDCGSCCEACECDCNCDCVCGCCKEVEDCGCCCCDGEERLDLGDLIPALPGKLMRSHSDESVFVATSAEVSLEQFEDYMLECCAWGFNSFVRRVVRYMDESRARDVRVFADSHNRMLTLVYNEFEKTCTVMVDSGVE